MAAEAVAEVNSRRGSRAGWGDAMASARVRRPLLIFLALVPLLTPVVSPRDDAPFIYPYTAAMDLLSAAYCWWAAQRNPGERVRWRTVALAQALHSISYMMPTVQGLGWLSGEAGGWVANACAATCTVLFLPALMGVRAIRGSWVRGLDYVLTGACCALLMVAMGSGQHAGEGMTRVTTSLLALVFVTLAALVARVASSNAGTRLFATVMLKYLGCCVVVCFLLNVVNLTMATTPNLLASDVLIAVPELMLCEWASRRRRVERVDLTRAMDPGVVDSLQPSLMALAGVGLALFGFRAHPVMRGLVVVGTVLCYAVRTQLFYFRLFGQQDELRMQATTLERLATRDALTGIGNRRWFDQAAQEMLNEIHGQPFAMLLVDTDRFKEINDSFGHLVGDEVLRRIAGELNELAGEVDGGCCARIGGDEFVAILPGVNAAEAVARAEGFRATVSAMEFQTPMPVTVSVGVAVAHEAMSLGKVFRRADAALYRVKADGRDGVHVIDLAGEE